MPRHHKRKHHSKKRHIKRHKGLSLKKVLTLINPPDSTRVTTTTACISPANKKTYFEVGLPNTTYNYAVTLGDMFLSMNWIYKMMKLSSNTPIITGEYWILKAYREVEFTNICNADIYLELNKLTSVKDWAGSDPILFMNNMMLNTALDNGPALVFNNDYVAPAAAVQPQITTNHCFENIFSGFYKTEFNDFWHVQSEKEICLKPQQSVKVKLFKHKPFLFAPARASAGLTNAALANFGNQQCYAYKTQALVVGFTGMTARVSPSVGSANYYQAAPVSLQYAIKDYMRMVPKSSPTRSEAAFVINDSMSTSGNAIEFGADAIAGVAVT